MGIIRTKIRLANPRNEPPRDIEVSAFADPGADVMCLPPSIVAEPGLEADTNRVVALADGGYQRCRYVGPVRVRFEQRQRYVGALELGDEILLGAIAMEDTDLVINLKLGAITANPEHPDGPQSTV